MDTITKLHLENLETILPIYTPNTKLNISSHGIEDDEGRIINVVYSGFNMYYDTDNHFMGNIESLPDKTIKLINKAVNFTLIQTSGIVIDQVDDTNPTKYELYNSIDNLTYSDFNGGDHIGDYTGITVKSYIDALEIQKIIYFNNLPI